jgi:hypothetical protein
MILKEATRLAFSVELRREELLGVRNREGRRQLFLASFDPSFSLGPLFILT